MSVFAVMELFCDRRSGDRLKPGVLVLGAQMPTVVRFEALDNWLVPVEFIGECGVKLCGKARHAYATRPAGNDVPRR